MNRKTTSKRNEITKVFSLLLCLLLVMAVIPTAIAAESPDTDENPCKVNVTVQTKWHKGYVGSSSNKSWANKLNTAANNYSYSDIITVEKAGTTITFADNASGYASASAYVISFWKESNGEWVIDTAHEQYAGAGGNGSNIESKNETTVTYTYTTKTANEHIRLCYCSGQTATVTPEFSKVYMTQGLDLSAYVKNPEIRTITDFHTIGAGNPVYDSAATNAAVTEEKGISVARVGSGPWYHTVEWDFKEAQNWEGMAGILIKVDFTSANTNTTQGGHGVSVGIHTATSNEASEDDETVTYNDTAFGGYAYNNAKEAWQRMIACPNKSDLLVVSVNNYYKYAGYIYIPLGAYGEAIPDLNSVTAISLYTGAITSGTAYIGGIYLVKGDLNPSIEVIGVQDTVEQGNSTYHVRFLAAVNTLGVQNYGFTLTADFTDENGTSRHISKTYSDTTVFTSFLADGETVTAPFGLYYAPLTITGIPRNVTVSFTVTPFLTLPDGTVANGASVKYSTSVNA